MSVPARRLKLLPALLVLIVLATLFALPAVASAAKTTVEPPVQWISASTKGTNGWRIAINGITGGRFKKTSVTVSAERGSDETVAYSAQGQVTRNGTIDAKLPGVGRIAVAFDQTSSRKEPLSDQGCRVEGQAMVYKGFLRGTIKLRGGGGFTKVDRTSARAEIFETPKTICPVAAEHHRRVESTSDQGESGTTALHIGRKLSGGELDFDAWRPVPSQRSSDNPFNQVSFIATYIEARHGLTTTIDVDSSARGDPGAFVSASPDGEPIEATVEPPAPFTGSAAFTLESPTVASWTGDLSVRLPVLGNVSLTAPSFWKALCEGTTCTQTLPPSVHLLFDSFFSAG